VNKPAEMKEPMPILAVCGKGGVGKTVFSALLSRVLMESGVVPLLLIDADPVGGLTAAIGEHAAHTLAGVRDQFIHTARSGVKAKIAQAAGQLDYFVLQALVEHNDYSLLAMGHNQEKGCFCPANNLLRSAINSLVSAFAGVVIDAEAGIEQINRDVTRRVTQVVVVVDASQRSLETLRMISEMIGASRIAVAANRVSADVKLHLPEGLRLLGRIPENEELRQFDREGRSLWQLPPGNAALEAVRNIARSFEWTPKKSVAKDSAKKGTCSNAPVDTHGHDHAHDHACGGHGHKHEH
jgi:CO dehydrogenase maturation factor